MKPFGSSLIKIEHEAVVTISIVNATHLSSNRLDHHLLQEASLHSDIGLTYVQFYCHLSILPRLLIHILWSISKAIVVLSIISLSGTKAL